VDEDIYLHKTITVRISGYSFRFRTSRELFSSHDLDTGTRLLLRSIIENDLTRAKTILDLGCGYGPLGLVLKKLNPESIIHLVDRDALAVSYAWQNAVLNTLDVPDIYGSLAYDDVRRRDFDLIVSNIPGKVGKPVSDYLLREGGNYLSPGGTMAVVVVNALEESVEQILDSNTDSEILFRIRRSGHAVFHYCFGNDKLKGPPTHGLEGGIYRRNELTFTTGNFSYRMETAYGLPEFDTLNYKTELLLEALNNTSLPPDIGRIAVYNPGLGHTAVVLWGVYRPREILLIDRDLLALRYSRKNLVLNGCPPERIAINHRVGTAFDSGAGIDLFIGALREEQGREPNYLLVKSAAAGLSPRGTIIIAAGSTAITRLVDDLEMRSSLRISTRTKRRGNGVLVIQTSGNKESKNLTTLKMHHI
jgi:16S rRNA (guanine1207-N2)-methyltransferase